MNSLEPWRHGIPVYAYPFLCMVRRGVELRGKDTDVMDVPLQTTMTGPTTTNMDGGPQRLELIREESRTPPNSETSSLTDRPPRTWTQSDPLAVTTTTITPPTMTSAIRRIRHAEVILADDVDTSIPIIGCDCAGQDPMEDLRDMYVSSRIRTRCR
jgi:hypothetical protein